ncbi:unnamed protein product [Rotaria magnacalcarata]|uniref:Uncharacterized protein n=1 Tax=Rotaria magnacalcarata TaxID=392030 RepID=A0A820G9U9_9BILA|nr:unnamed protein product [Rotaria magnacalcarata]
MPYRVSSVMIDDNIYLNAIDADSKRLPSPSSKRTPVPTTSCKPSGEHKPQPTLPKPSYSGLSTDVRKYLCTEDRKRIIRIFSMVITRRQASASVASTVDSKTPDKINDQSKSTTRHRPFTRISKRLSSPSPSNFIHRSCPQLSKKCVNNDNVKLFS